ncbi:elastin [Drosophila montana]|uniref:elastin n=1 Tax=Drosophila montana TaxID=40370 RepID=UPI00313B8B23
MKSIAHKSSLLLSVLLLLSSSCQAQPVNAEAREQRQLKSSPAAAAEADVKMLAASTANMTPVSMPMGGMMAMSPMALGGGINMQLAQYPGYQAGMMPFLGLNGLPGAGLQTSIASGYPGEPGMGFGLGAGAGGNPGFGLGAPTAGFGLGAPTAGFGVGSPTAGFGVGVPTAGFMYGNPLYANPQLGAGFGPQPTLDNFAALNNIFNMQQAGGLYGQVAAGPLPGYFGGMAGGLDGGNGLLERMKMRSYAPGF